MSDEMSRVSCIWDSVVERDEPQIFKALIQIATDSNCELRFLGWESPEGYGIRRYIISASAHENWERFKEAIAKAIPNSDWSPLSDEEFMQMFSYKGRLTWSIQEELEHSAIYVNSTMDTVSSTATYNAKLREKLATNTPIYFTYDWILPASVDACESWLETLFEALWKLSFGCRIRFFGKLKRDGDIHIQTLVLRVFALDELDALKAKISFDSTNGGWQSASEDIFFKATLFTIHSVIEQIKSS